jgi:NAD(P)-dependent dehydrogenase (short-subunit alcohol dehydrogenase family)
MKVAIITGGSRGVGKSAALNVARRGTGVILTYNCHPDEAEAVVSEIQKSGGKAAALKLDVTKTASFGDFVSLVEQTLQKEWSQKTFDYLVNNAGTAQRTLIKDTTEEQFDQLTNVHLKGPFFLTQKLIPLMADGGLVLNVSSGLTRFTNPAGVATYASLKGAMEVFTKYIVREYASRKIRANIVAPGALDTQFAGPNGRDENQKKMIGEHTALGRCGEADDIGPLIAALLSDDCRWVNGQRIEATGGVLI